jgi:hypothetical protein
VSQVPCSQPLSLESLIAYRQAELDVREDERIEEHLFECAVCSEQLETLERLGAGVARLMRSGLVFGGTTLSALEKAAAEGLRIGWYRLEPGQSVECTIAPGDDCNVARFAAPLSDIERVDMSFVYTEAGLQTFATRFEDLVVDRAHQEVVILHPAPMLRRLGRVTIQIEMVAHERGEQRTVAHYTLYHSPPAASR